MSFLFKKKKNPFGGNKTGGAPKPIARRLPPSASHRLHRSSASAGSGQTQLTLQRKQETKQKENATQQSQGVISMAEVMKDLRILEEQQRESEQQVLHARQTKERHLEMLASHQAQLQRLKYTNGQEKARLIRMRELLANGLRSLQCAKDDAARIGLDLGGLDQQLQRALETKRSILSCERRQDRFLSEMQRKVNFVIKLRQEADEQVLQAEKKRDEIKNREEVLHATFQQEASKVQAIKQQTVDVRSSSASLEQELADIKKEQTHKMQMIENLKKELADEDSRHNDAMAACDAKLQALDRFKAEMHDKLLDKNRDLAKKKEELHESWKRLIEIQTAEGHSPSLPPAETSQPPVLDLARIRESVQAEAKAAADEAAAKNDLEAEVATMQKELAKLKEESEETRKQAAQLTESNKAAHDIEKERKKALDDFFKDFEKTKKKYDELNATIPQLQDRRDAELAEAKERTHQARLEFEEVQEALANAEKQAKDTDAKLQVVEAEYQERVAASGVTLEEIQSKVAVARNTYQELKEEADRVKEQSLDLEASEPEDADGIPVEEMKAKIEKLVKDYPALETVDFVYDRNKTTEEQLKESLYMLRKDCKKRLDSAKKMKAELKEAKEREEQERLLVEQAAAAEKKRKEQARERRKKRLQAESSTDPDKKDAPDKVLKRQEKLKRRNEKQQPEEATVVEPSAKQDESMSAAKPRTLLDVFTQASFDQEADEDDASVTDPEDVESSLMQEKKVHWGDAVKESKNDSGALDAKDGSFTSNTTHSGSSRRRKAFGGLNSSSADTRESSTHRSRSRSKDSSSKSGSRRHSKSDALKSEDLEQARSSKHSSKDGKTSKHSSHSLVDGDDALDLTSSLKNTSTNREKTKHNSRSTSDKGEQTGTDSLEQAHKNRDKSKTGILKASSKTRDDAKPGSKKATSIKREQSIEDRKKKSRDHHSHASKRKPSDLSKTKDYSKHREKSSKTKSSSAAMDLGTKPERPKKKSRSSRTLDDKKSRTAKLQAEANVTKKSSASNDKRSRGLDNKSLQTSGISTMERAPKRRRRKGNHAGGKKGLQSFGEDRGFNFVQHL